MIERLWKELKVRPKSIELKDDNGFIRYDFFDGRYGYLLKDNESVDTMISNINEAVRLRQYR